jgi:Lar family restriction alleviation protein
VSTSNNIKLLPCPFCGATARHFSTPDENNRLSYGIQCGGSDCSITGPERGNPEDAAAAWNRRSPLPVQAGEGEANADLQTVHKFLLGEGQLDGFGFGDSDTARPRGRYWWRKNLLAAIKAGGREAGPKATPETAETRMDTGSQGGPKPGANMAGAGGQGGEDGWISVEDRLPEDGETVLAWAGDHIVLERWMERHESPVGWSSVTMPIGPAWDDHEFEDITHWMPLPGAPRATPAKANDGEGAA